MAADEGTSRLALHRERAYRVFRRVGIRPMDRGERANRVRQKRHGSRLLVAALTAMLAGHLSGASGLVFCLGTDGHRAIELDHGGRECPTLAGSQDAAGISAQPPIECLDLPAAGGGAMVPSSFDADRVSMPPLASLAATPEPVPPIETRLPAAIAGRSGPLNFALHLTSTVLLV